MTLDDLHSLGITYFASGSNAVGEILGLDDMGVDVGVAVPELGEEAIQTLCGLADTGRRVFVDSGAFSEVKFTASGPTWPKPITDEEWRERLAVYRRLAEALGEQVYLVAPDRVADQAGTIARLVEYAAEVVQLRELGANVLVPLQKGTRSMHAAQLAAALALGFDDFIPAIPMKKDATSVEELVEYLQGAQPDRVHLLGLGAHSRKLEAVLEAVREASPDTEVFLDAVLVRGMVGRKEGVRRLTAAQDVARGQLAPFADTEAADYTDLISAPDAWLIGANRKRAATELELRGGERKVFLESPESWLEARPDLAEQASVVMDDAWARWWLQTQSGTAIKRPGIRRALAPGPQAPTPDEGRYLFEGTRTSPEDWREELAELRTVLPDDPEWPYGQYLIPWADAEDVINELDELELWGRVESEDEDGLLWQTVAASVRKKGVEIVLLLEGHSWQRPLDDAWYLVLVARPEARRGWEPLELPAEVEEDEDEDEREEDDHEEDDD